MSRIKPFVTRDFPVTIKEIECWTSISMEKSGYFWNFAFAKDEEEIDINYEDILELLPQLKQETGLDLQVITARKKITRKDFVNEYYILANGKYLELGSEEDYTAEQMQSIIISTIASLIYHNEIFGNINTERKDEAHE